MQTTPTGVSNEDRGEIALRLRIGVSGHRGITLDQPGLVRAVDDVLTAITGVQVSISTRSTQVSPTVVSSLAEGADRLLANAVLRRDGAELEAILPLERTDYCDDFGSTVSKAEFNALLTQAVAVDVIGAAESRDHAYESAGRAVVDRSDVMVVVWDGQPARGRGGTAEIRDYAIRRKKPVFWIRVDSEAAELVTEPSDLAPSVAPLPPKAFGRLDHYNGEHLPSSLFTGPPPLLTRLSADGRLNDATLLIEHFSRYFIRADGLASRFQRRWFWITRLIYTLAAVAVVIVAAQILFAPNHQRYAWFEFGVLVCVTVLLIIARFAQWHHRWISARYLAEQIRSLVFLGLSGVATPHDPTSLVGSHADPAEESDWIARAVAEIWWSRPRCDPTDDVSFIRSVLESEWITDQLEYHLKTSRRYEKRSRRFAIAAVSLFALSAGAALLHSLGAGPDLVRPYTLWDFLSIVIPAIGAALSGYGAQRDYARHAERSMKFAANLAEARYRLREAPTLDDIRQVALSISRIMRIETTDWYSIVHSQDVEPP
jgi:hypothetical protein